MPGMSVKSYVAPEALEAAYVAARTEITPIGPAPFGARVVRLELDRMWIHRVDERSPRIKWAAQSPARTFIRFLTRPSANFVIDGTVLRPGEIVHLGSGHNYYDRTDGAVHWSGISVPDEDVAAAAIAITGRALVTPREPVHHAPAPAAIKRLRRIHAEAIAVAKAELPAETIRNLEQTLIEATIDCLSDRDARKPSWACRSRATVMRRFHRLLEAAPDRAFYLPEICAAITVPERTLRVACQEQIGISPKHYLLLRRLHLAHRALQAADASATSVTEVAMRFGFWHLGRFAGAYRMVFGEMPSRTLEHDQADRAA